MSARGGARRRPKPEREELVCHDDVRVKPLIVHVHSCLRPPLAVCECDLLLRVPSGEPDLEAFPGAVLPGRARVQLAWECEDEQRYPWLLPFVGQQVSPD